MNFKSSSFVKLKTLYPQNLKFDNFDSFGDIGISIIRIGLLVIYQ